MNDHLEEKINQYSDMIYRCAYSFCRNRSDAEDIMQEVFYRYLKKKPVFSDENHEKAWFLRVTINLSKNYVHSFWHCKTEVITEQVPDVTKEESEIWELVHLLPERYRMVLELKYRDGYEIKEIAEILGKKPSTVGTWLQRGRERLKKMLEEKR